MDSRNLSKLGHPRTKTATLNLRRCFNKKKSEVQMESEEVKQAYLDDFITVNLA